MVSAADPTIWMDNSFEGGRAQDINLDTVKVTNGKG